MSLRIAFSGGPLNGEVLTTVDTPEADPSALDLPKHVFRVTSHGRVGSSFDIFDPDELPLAESVGRSLSLHHYRVDDRHIANDATIWVVARYVGVTGREIAPDYRAIHQWASPDRSTPISHD